MTARSFTLEEFEEAVRKVIAAGQEPSVRNVRAALGDRGSHSTLGPLLDALPAKQEGTPITKPPPAAVVAKGNELMARTWEAAVQQAAEELDAVRHCLDAKSAALDKKLAESRHSLDGMEASCAQLQRSLADEVEAREAEARRRFDAEERAARAEAENRHLRARIEALERGNAPSPTPAKLLDELLRLAQAQAIATPARTRPRGAGKTKGATTVT
jgi:uncharacterized membrane-anchored protein YhcB (DUF1043 family)